MATACPQTDEDAARAAGTWLRRWAGMEGRIPVRKREQRVAMLPLLACWAAVVRRRKRDRKAAYRRTPAQRAHQRAYMADYRRRRADAARRPAGQSEE